MNKYLVISVLVAVIAGAIYLTREDVVPIAQESTSSPVSTSVAVPRNDNASVAPASEKTQEASHSNAQSSSESQSSITSITVEQTQNAVDFNAPGAGTAQQKANAAAAATKAYQGAKQ